MANLPESPSFEANIYQLETTDPVLGGADGIANQQAKQLANRTQWLKQQVDALNGSASKQPPAFSVAKAYTAGDVVSHLKNLWRANTNIAAGAFNQANWTKILGTAAELDASAFGGSIIQASDAAAARTILNVYSQDQINALVADESLINAIIFG